MVLHQAPSEVMVLGPVQTSQMDLLRVQLATWVSQVLATPNGLKEVLAVFQQIAFTGPRQMPLHWRVWNPMLFLQMALNQDREALTEVTEAEHGNGSGANYPALQSMGGSGPFQSDSDTGQMECLPAPNPGIRETRSSSSFQ